MPTTIYYRTWCKKCKDWELHYSEFSTPDTWVCRDCGTEHGTTYYKDIPKDKIQEQRERYKAKRLSFVERALGGMILGGMSSLFDMEQHVEVRECDAGQKRIEEAERIKETEKRYKRLEQKQKDSKEKAKYKGLRRNEICICGSGIKYKKCCLPKIEKL